MLAKKQDEYGTVIKYKARLVAKCFKQKDGVAIFVTYSPVANMNSIRVVLAVIVAKGYVSEQMNVDTAFRNSHLNKKVHMDVPKGLSATKGMLYKMEKAISGLSQAASVWYKTIHALFMKIGFQSCGVDQCVYVQCNRGNMVYVCLNVNDMIIAAKTNEEIASVKNVLKGSYKMKELRTTKFILGMEAKHDLRTGILTIKQTRHINYVCGAMV